MMKFVSTILSIAALFGSASAFAPSTGFGVHQSAAVEHKTFGRPQGTSYIAEQYPTAIQRQRSSVASVQTMGLFGLGAPEIAVILLVGAFVLGPTKLAELGKEAGKMAGELKEVPKEFQAGLSEGEKQAEEIKKEISGVKDAEKE